MIYRLTEKFHETGFVEDVLRIGRPITIRTEENTHIVSETFRRNPQPSQRPPSLELDISRRSLGRIM
jgi:hypothetical protein